MVMERKRHPLLHLQIMKEYDVIAIGDTVVDAFIRLKDASVHCSVNKEDCELCMRFGDKVPFEAAYVLPAVGNAANAAVSCARLGLSSALVASVGGDRYGQDCKDALQKNGVGTEFIAVHPDKPTNYHYVLWYEDERTILIKHEEYPYVLPDIGSPKWIYLSSTAEGARTFHHDLGKWLVAHPETKLAFQPGTFQMKMGVEELKDIYQATTIFFCNREEAARITGVSTDDMHGLLNAVQALGPKQVVITDGPKGAYIAEGEHAWFMPPYPDPQPPFERTGAGDAFASTVVAGLANGLSLNEAILWGPINSMAVVQKVGAQEGLLTKEQLTTLLAQAPAMYSPQPLP
jgi:sugar/nucleoside kinase (ribokinase family)